MCCQAATGQFHCPAAIFRGKERVVQREIERGARETNRPREKEREGDINNSYTYFVP